MKPICVKDRCFYRPHRNGVWFTEGMPSGGPGPTPRGNRAPHRWKPYKLWQGDLWKCPECGHEIISGVAPQPLAEHYQPGFEATRMKLSRLQVNDC